MIAQEKHRTRFRESVIVNAMPDTCVITPPSGEAVVSEDGVLLRAEAAPRVWRGQTVIPCRLDLHRAVHLEKFNMQIVIGDQFELHLPFDVEVSHADLITVNGSPMHIRRVKEPSATDITRELMVTYVSKDDNQ